MYDYTAKSFRAVMDHLEDLHVCQIVRECAVCQELAKVCAEPELVADVNREAAESADVKVPA